MSDRKDLAVQALARAETVSGLAARHGVSRKFVYQQTRKVRAALDDAFSPATPDDEVLFELAVTKAWLHQVIVGLTLICRSSYRGVVEFLRDLLSVSVSLGSVHGVLEAATRQASVINREQDLSGIRVGLHDEIFQGATPVLAGVDAQSTFCYILAAEDHRDADTWGVHLLDAAAQGLRPDDVVQGWVTHEAGLTLSGGMMAPSRFQRWCEYGSRHRADSGTETVRASDPGRTVERACDLCDCNERLPRVGE